MHCSHESCDRKHATDREAANWINAHDLSVRAIRGGLAHGVRAPQQLQSAGLLDGFFWASSTVLWRCGPRTSQSVFDTCTPEYHHDDVQLYCTYRHRVTHTTTLTSSQAQGHTSSHLHSNRSLRLLNAGLMPDDVPTNQLAHAWNCSLSVCVCLPLCCVCVCAA